MPDVSHLPDAVFESRDIRTFNGLFVRLPEIRFYAVLLLVAAVAAVWLASSVWELVLPVVGIALFYPGFEYVLHRWVLHNAQLCRTPITSRIWWRLHYRHHSAPRDAAVILGAPWTLLVAVAVGALLTASVYWTLAALAAATAASLAAAIVYEYFHSLEHSRVELTNPYLLRMRKHHLAHHYITERHNFGIATDIVDRLVGTTASYNDDVQRSPTVYNLGYTGEMTQNYPWVNEIEREVGPARKAPNADAQTRDAT
jgi:sterol desaturase/sphingolipid hydroxylase (fatty acid hydroxylase superfamily)